MLTSAAIVLTFWTAITLLMTGGTLVNILLRGGYPPIAYIALSRDELAVLSQRARLLIRSLGVLFNASGLALMMLTTVVIWSSLVDEHSWAWWGIAAAGTIVQAFGFAADALIGNRTLGTSIATTALFGVGIALAGIALVR